MEVEILKNDLEIVKQKLELANKELESKDKIIEQMNETIDILKWRVEVQDIMEIFNKESDFALRFLRVAKSIGFGIQVGKEYYIKREEFEKMLNTYQGLKLEI